jgi:hypothetical protein
MDWLVPLRKRGRSASNTLNVLGREGNVFVMDNHLAAAWCWAQVLDPTEQYDLVHIDAHYDWQNSIVGYELTSVPSSLFALELTTYLASTYAMSGSQPFQTFRWDSYLAIFEALHGQLVVDWSFCTHDQGDAPAGLAGYQEVAIWNLFRNLELLGTSPRRCILNLDLDFFFFDGPGDHIVRWASPEYVASIGKLLAALQKQGKLAVVTIALSPECCGGWKPAETVMSEFMQALGVPVTLRVGKEP